MASTSDKQNDDGLQHIRSYFGRGMSMKIRQAASERKVKAVTYNSANHLEVLTKIHGSIIPRVLPHCILNCAFTLAIYYLRLYGIVDLTFSHQGHTYMSIMVSFLVVTRVKIAYARFMNAREYLMIAMKSSRELMQHVVCFTRFDTSPKATEWRTVIARRVVVLLRSLASLLEYPSKEVDTWKRPELSIDEKTALLTFVGKSNDRTPMVLTVFLRTAIACHAGALHTPIHVNKELRLLSFTSEFVEAVHGLVKLMSTPFPFPLVQMNRTFLLVWVFTLPCALLKDISKLPALLLMVSAMTIGFIGLEYVSIAMDDPFGDDPTDFDVNGLVEVVFDDIYILLQDVDGAEVADQLRKNMSQPLPDLAQNTARSHKRFASVDAWNMASPLSTVDPNLRSSKLINREKTKKPAQSQESNDIFTSVFNDEPLETLFEQESSNRTHPLKKNVAKGIDVNVKSNGSMEKADLV